MKNKMIPKKKKLKHGRTTEALVLLFNLNGFTHEFIDPKTNNIFINNLGPNNEPRNAQISHY
jgi:hypothetical protein